MKLNIQFLRNDIKNIDETYERFYKSSKNIHQKLMIKDWGVKLCKNLKEHYKILLEKEKYKEDLELLNWLSQKINYS